MFALTTFTRASMLCLCALMITTPAQSAEQLPKPVVVELFTSQGCNSCPPADALLGTIAKRPNVLALAYHVQYWDALGWHDRFGLPIAVQRQYGYVSTLKLPSAFTPQMIVNGQYSLVGANERRLWSLLEAASVDATGTITLQLTDSALHIEVSQPLPPTTDAVLVSYLARADTPIPRGENSGKTLREFNIVRSVTPLGPVQGTHQEFTVPLAQLPDEATHVAVLLQQSSYGVILDAASVALGHRQ